MYHSHKPLPIRSPETLKDSKGKNFSTSYKRTKLQFVDLPFSAKELFKEPEKAAETSQLTGVRQETIAKTAENQLAVFLGWNGFTKPYVITVSLSMPSGSGFTFQSYTLVILLHFHRLWDAHRSKSHNDPTVHGNTDHFASIRNFTRIIIHLLCIIIMLSVVKRTYYN